MPAPGSPPAGGAVPPTAGCGCPEQPEPGWTWAYEGYRPEQEALREALCTLGNGYFATRGAAGERPADDVHYPGTYAAGLYDRATSSVAGREVTNEDMVNLPDWLPLRYRIRPDGAWLAPDGPELVDHRQVLDLRHGELTTEAVYQDEAGRRLRVTQLRLVHMRDPHLAMQRTVFTALGWDGDLEVESALEGDVRNAGVARYRNLQGRHLTALRTGTGDRDGVWLRCRTLTSDVTVAMAARTLAGAGKTQRYEPFTGPTRAGHRITARLGPGSPLVVDKVVALHTSRDTAVSDPLAAAVERVARARPFTDLRHEHRTAWHHLWHGARLEVPGKAGRILRLHQFHVLQTLSPHTAALDVGVPARGLHGEAYRGHVFWDELFVLPYLDFHFPEISRAALDYRWRRLPQACRAAADSGRRGAMYPWQSGSDGREESQTLHLNPRSGRWLPDHSHLQHHVGSAVAYNVWRYHQATGDTAYLHTRGGEMLLQIARFWADGAEPGADGRYGLHGVVGPDEYHDAYPGADQPGLRDNTYTNVTAAWVLQRALDLLERMPEPRRRALCEQLALDASELTRWEEVSRRLRVPHHAGVISQFEGYGDLRELDWDRYRRQYGDIRRLDRVLEAEGDSTNRYQVCKQADVLMLGYLFSPRELAGVFDRLGYRLTDDLWRATTDYYLPRTSHGSTLSSLVHAWVLARERRPEAWRQAREALDSDVADVQGGTTAEGVHLGAMAGTLDLLQRGLTGLEADGDVLVLDPAPLPHLSKFRFTLRFRRHWDIDVKVRRQRLCVTVPASTEAPLRLVVAGREHLLAPGESRWLSL
ncbi:glycoside hydrolase family 65 protein [Streptomyces sp. NPDC059740]|uniref:glycoside hydrolase family 65 protein n=1 Tax=Streptomyces sp. NPDC059740 TaxID=3346926 RepID=UPI00364DDB57